jgi:restriction system protein
MPRRSRRPALHPSRQVLALAVSLCALAALLLAMSVSLRGARSPVLAALASQLTTPAWSVLLVGLVLGVVGYALRPRQPDAPRRVEPEWYPRSTDFVRSSVMVAPAEAAPERRAPASQWSAQVFDDIEWRRFEALCAELFAQAGFEARTQSHGADGGVDIWLHSRHAEGPAMVVQCKHWHGKAVGVKEVRELLGVMASHRLARGTYATTSTFTAEALRFARENGIHTLDGQGLLTLIGQRTPAQQQALLARAYEGEYWRPTCASCGQKMVSRTARKGDRDFWGCADFPRCRATLPMRA